MDGAILLCLRERGGTARRDGGADHYRWVMWNGVRRSWGQGYGVKRGCYTCLLFARFNELIVSE